MPELRKELYDFYLNKCDKLSENFQRKIYGILDGIDTSGMNGYERKTLQYKTIAEHCEPVFFENSPFYFEMGTLAAVCDGCGEIRGHKHAGNWNWERSYHLFEEKDTVLFRQLTKQAGNLLYLICGPYADTRQHFIFNMKPVFAHGLRGIYEEAQKQLADATGEEADFLKASMQGLLCLKQISERFAQRATERLQSTKNELFRANLERIAVLHQNARGRSLQTSMRRLMHSAFAGLCAAHLRALAIIPSAGLMLSFCHSMKTTSKAACLQGMRHLSLSATFF